MITKSSPITNIYYNKITWNTNIYFFLPILQLVSKILCHVFIVTFGFWMQHFQTGGLGEMVRHPGHHDRRISSPLTSFYRGTLTLRLLTLYINHASCNARDPNVIYIYITLNFKPFWQRCQPVFPFSVQCLYTESVLGSFL